MLRMASAEPRGLVVQKANCRHQQKRFGFSERMAEFLILIYETKLKFKQETCTSVAVDW